jgi:hypothetical protein
MPYGQLIPNLTIDGQAANYPVINERAVRATAGLMFALGFFTLLTTVYTKNLTLASWVIPLFWLDFLLKAINPKLSIFGLIGRQFVRGQKPDYVGAVQKRFAWSLGLMMASAVWLILFVFKIRGALPLSLCSICLALMWLESACGICLGCKIYYWLRRRGIVKDPGHNPACPGGVCAVK